MTTNKNFPVTMKLVTCCEECYFLFIDKKYACEIKGYRIIKKHMLNEIPNWCPLLKQNFVIQVHKDQIIYDDSCNFVSAQELALFINPIGTLTTFKLNKTLEEKGFQYKRKEPHWTKDRWNLTEKGKQFGKMYSTCEFAKIIWNTKITEEL